MTKNEHVVLAVVGAGAWGKNLVRNFASLESVELRYVCDRRPSVREEIAARHPSTRVIAELDAVLADSEVHGVVVAAEAPAHAQLARAALRADKDVFVEKPLTLTSREGSELCQLADERGKILMVGHLLLYHPAVEALRAFVDRGELGTLHYVSSRRLNLGIVRRDENAFWSLAPHDISVANALFGGEPLTVSATGKSYLQPERGVEDVVFATLEYPGRRLAHLHVSWLDPSKTRAMTVVGSRKMAVFDDTAPRKLVLYDKGIDQIPLEPAEPVIVRNGPEDPIEIPSTEPLRRECEDFVASIRTRRSPRADGRSGLAVVRVLEAGTRSLRAEGRSVRLEEIA